MRITMLATQLALVSFLAIGGTAAAHAESKTDGGTTSRNAAMPHGAMPADPMPHGDMPGEAMPSDAMAPDAMSPGAVPSDAMPPHTMPSEPMPPKMKPSARMQLPLWNDPEFTKG